MLKKLLLIIIFSFLLTNFSNAKNVYYKCDISKIKISPFNSYEPAITKDNYEILKLFEFFSFKDEKVEFGLNTLDHSNYMNVDWYPAGQIWDIRFHNLFVSSDIVIFSVGAHEIILPNNEIDLDSSLILSFERWKKDNAKDVGSSLELFTHFLKSLKYDLIIPQQLKRRIVNFEDLHDAKKINDNIKIINNNPKTQYKKITTANLLYFSRTTDKLYTRPYINPDYVKCIEIERKDLPIENL
tara:strand:+ start:96 stop:818 length:723 start_codon:yes stop_codon:yes gene_type:complete